LIIQHLAPEGPYAIATALAAAGVRQDVAPVFRGAPLPRDLAGFDGLVVLGGPMAADSDEGFPTRRAELALLADALERGVPTLGVCLGAQLLAHAAGGRVYRGTTGPEIGWAPVVLTPAAPDDPLLSALPPEPTVLHWHGDTFDLPTGAVHLAGNARYENQAFRLGDAAWGLQFHVEIDQTAVDAFIAEFGDELAPAGATPDQLAAATPGALARLEPHRDRLLARFAARVATPQPHQQQQQHERQPVAGPS
jgi:GMP synthase-like glutamine amidotransferase